MLAINERKTKDITILELEGNLIMGGPGNAVRDKLRDLTENGGKKVLIDFGGVRYVDSSGVGELVAGAVSMSRAGAQLKICRLPEKVMQVMSLSSVLSIFEVYDNEIDALREFE
jgi:anti-sigma B factor antagonist